CRARHARGRGDAAGGRADARAPPPGPDRRRLRPHPRAAPGHEPGCGPHGAPRPGRPPGVGSACARRRPPGPSAQTKEATMARESAAGTVIIGAGLTAAHVIETLTAGGYADPITLVGDEGEPPYERPPLSKEALQGGAPYEDAYVHDEDWYRQAGVRLHLDDAAIALDPAARTVRLASGTTLAYDRLVLATGARPRLLDLPGADAAGVVTLRSMADSRRLHERLTPGARVVIVG